MSDDPRRWFARPWVWVVLLLVCIVLPFSGVHADGFVTGLIAVAALALVGAVIATIAQAHRWGSRGVVVVAWVCGLGTLAGEVYRATRPEYDNGIGDGAIVLLLNLGLIAAAWSCQPPRVPDQARR